VIGINRINHKNYKLKLMSLIARSQREISRRKQKAGIAAAKARGVRLGRPPVNLPDDFDMLLKQWEEGLLSTKDLEEQTGLKRRTLYRRIHEYSAKTDNQVELTNAL